MARTFFTGEITHEPDANPRTLIQIIAATNVRAFLSYIDMQPGGSTGATAPIPFDMLLQTDDGTSSGSNAFTKSLPQAAHTLQTTRKYTFTVEPTSGDIVDSFALHQQGHQTWIPNGKGIVIPANSVLGIRYLSDTFVKVTLRFHLEE